MFSMTINKRSLIFPLISILLCSFFVGIVSARGGVFVVEPTQEVTEEVKLTVSDEVKGNLSVNDGFVDFYIESPSGAILFSDNKITFTIFNFTAEENGNYTMHVANNYQTRNVNVTLDYSVSMKVNLYGEVNARFYLPQTWTVTPPPSATTPIDWIRILTEFLKMVGISGIGYLVKAIRHLRWWWKYRKSRTPVVFKPLLSKICEILG